jgi:TetR/AcrR family transcriptional regulator, fatty acid metabolism regulator protein
VHSETQTIDQPKVSFIEQARRAQIIDCAIDAIAELGFAQASLAQIAKRAGVSTGVILYYFAGKDHLIRAVAAHVFATGEAFMTPLVSRETTAAGALAAFIHASVTFIAEYPRMPLAIMNIIRAGVDQGGGPRFDPGITATRRDGFERILTWGQDTGAFRDFSVPVMAATIIEAVDVIPQLLAANRDLDLDAYATELVELFDRASRADPTSIEAKVA